MVHPPDGLADNEVYGVALTVHMATLAAVDAYLHAETVPDDPGRLSEYLLGRELGHWQALRAHSRELPTVDAQTMSRTVFAASLAGPLGHAEGVAVVERVGLAREPTAVQQVLDAHAQCYPQQDQATVLEPLYPDRLAEDFLALLTPGHPHGQAADPWTATALRALLAAAQHGRDGQDGPHPEPPSYARQAVIVLIETAARWEHVARTQLYPLLREQPRLALSAGGAGLVTLAGLPHLDPAVLEAIEPHLPDHHVDLDIGTAACAERLTKHRLATAKNTAERAKLHRDLGIREGNAGLRDRALSSLQRAVDLFGEVPAPDAAEARTDHAWALLNLGISLLHEGRHAAAYAVVKESVARFEQATDDDPIRAGEGLAAGLDMLEVAMSHMGYRREALNLARLVLEARQTQPKTDAKSYARLARALLNYGNRLAQQGSHRQAKATTRDALEIFRRLAADDPDAYTPDLARALVNWSEDLSRTGEEDESLDAAQESAMLYRSLAGMNSAAFQTDLATSLINLGAVHGRARRYHAARDSTAEALTTLGNPREAASAAYRTTRAFTLSRLALWLAHLDDTEQAAAYIGEAIALSRTLKPTDSVDGRGHIARTLMQTAFPLAVLGRPEDALAAMEASAKLYRHLAGADTSFDEEAAMATRALALARSMGSVNYGTMMASLRTKLERVTGPIGAPLGSIPSPMTPPNLPTPPDKRVQPKKRTRRQRRKPKP